MAKHAFLSASGAPAWLRCEAKPWREEGLPDKTSEYAIEGTRAHAMLEDLLLAYCTNPADFIAKDRERLIESSLEMATHYDPDMAEYVAKTYEYVTSIGVWSNVYPEQRLSISHITGEEGAEGTADVVIVKGTELTVVDLKYGMGVKVEAEENEQLLIYGAAALKEFDLIGEIKTLKLVISQPRLNFISEWILTVEEVDKRIEAIKEIGNRILSTKGGGPHLLAIPGDKQCRFCKVKATCQEYRAFTFSTVADDFVDLSQSSQVIEKVKAAEVRVVNSDDQHLATCMDAVDLIEQWCKAVRDEVRTRLMQDNFTDTRWKLVKGKAGNRALGGTEDDLIDIADHHGVPVDQLFQKKLQSIPQLEKQFKKDHPVFWAKVEGLIVRTDGQPTMAPASDKRPAINNMVLSFQVLEDDEFGEALIGLTK